MSLSFSLDQTVSVDFSLPVALISPYFFSVFLTAVELFPLGEKFPFGWELVRKWLGTGTSVESGIKGIAHQF